MNEHFLQFIWKHKLFSQKSLHTITGESLTILNSGEFNEHHGPDFLNAKIKIGNTIWAGNIELHINSSDYFKHQHQQNPLYQNLILHVVWKHDAPNTLPFATFELNGNIPLHYLRNYETLLGANQKLSCSNIFEKINHLDKIAWLDRLVWERLERKSNYIFELQFQNKNYWEATFFQILAQNFGQKANAATMQNLAASIPIMELGKIKNNLLQVEALLFGQANLIPEDVSDAYIISLKNEFTFLKKKFNLQEIFTDWKFAKLRPANFPTIRIAQLASLIHKSSALFSKILDEENLENIRAMFDLQPSQYWQSHYNFYKEHQFQTHKLGKQAIDNILINTVIQILFAYGLYNKEDKYCNRALSYLEQITAEKNAVVKNYEALQVPVNNAFETQALIELYTQYCLQKKCLNCNWGKKIIASTQ